MPTIDGTDLEYTESESIVLDYWLGTNHETKEQWAQRVWNKCKEYSETDGLGHDGKGMSKVYSSSAEDLWANKKVKRRVALKKELSLLNDDDQTILSLKHDQRYTTRTERHNEKLEKQRVSNESSAVKAKQKLDFYKNQGRSDVDILLTHPELKHSIEMKMMCNSEEITCHQ